MSDTIHRYSFIDLSMTGILQNMWIACCSFKLQLYLYPFIEAADPIVTDLGSNLCTDDKICEHGCNRKTGICSCTQGYVLFGETKCTGMSQIESHGWMEE